jgi:hypothetical protein
MCHRYVGTLAVEHRLCDLVIELPDGGGVDIEDQRHVRRASGAVQV